MIIRLTGGLLLLSSILALGIAWYVEHVAGYVPCELCLLERDPWRITLILGVLALLIPGRIGFWACVVAVPVLLVDAAIGGVHVGVEQRWWESPLPSCHAPVFHGGNFHERLASMPLRPVKPCEDPTYVFHLPISMSALGMVAALGLACVTLYALRRQVRAERVRPNAF